MMIQNAFKSFCFATALLIGVARFVLAQGPAALEDQTLRAMLGHGLPSAAVEYVVARQQLESNPNLRAWWVMREMECHARWAMQSAADAEEHFSRCDEIADAWQISLADGTSSSDASSRWPWIQWQLTRCRLLRAQSTLAKYLAAPTNERPREQALALVREIVQRLKELNQEIKRRQPLAARMQLAQHAEATAEQLRNLDADVQLLHCEALMVRWQLYPVGSDDRSAALAEVQTTATDFLRTVRDAGAQSTLQLALAMSELESGDQNALQKLQQLAMKSDSSQVRIMAAAAAAKDLAQRGEFSRARAAVKLAESIATSDASVAPLAILTDIEVAKLELGTLAEDRRESSLKSLVAKARDLGDRFGDYWKSRAEALLVGELSSSNVNDAGLAMDLLLAEVRQLAAKGDEASLRAAADRLLEGRDTQAASGNGEAAVRLANLANALFHKLKDWSAAKSASEAVSLQFPIAADAAEAHQSVVTAHIELLRQATGDATLRDDYVRLLQDQLRWWPEPEISQKSKSMLADWCLATGQRGHYVSGLQGMLLGSKDRQFAERLLLEICQQMMLLPIEERESAVAQWLASDDSAAATVDPLAKQMALAVVILSDQIYSDFLRDDVSPQVNFEQFDSARLATPTQLLAPFFEAVADVGRLQNGLPLRQFASGWESVDTKVRPALTLALIDGIDRSDWQVQSSLRASLPMKLDWIEIDTSASVAQQAATLRLSSLLGDSAANNSLVALVAANSRNAELQLLFSYYLNHTGDRQAAIKTATQLAGLSKAGSNRALAARWSLLRFQALDGDPAAVKSAELLIVSQPNLSERWRERFQQITK